MARPKKKNADYFSHDSDMRNDPKIRAIRRKYGIEGYAVWNMILEILTDSDFFEYEWTELNVELIAGDFDIEPEKLNDIVDYCITLKLLSKDENRIYSEKMKERFESLLIKRNRDRKPANEELSSAETKDKEVIASENTQSKVKESKVKESNKKFTKKDFKAELISLGAEEKIVNDWMQVRSEKKAVNTETALNTFLNECKKNNFPVGEAVRICAEKSWKGFKFEWLKNLTNGINNHTEPRINRQSADIIRQNSVGWEIE